MGKTAAIEFSATDITLFTARKAIFPLETL